MNYQTAELPCNFPSYYSIDSLLRLPIWHVNLLWLCIGGEHTKINAIIRTPDPQIMRLREQRHKMIKGRSQDKLLHPENG